MAAQKGGRGGRRGDDLGVICGCDGDGDWQLELRRMGVGGIGVGVCSDWGWERGRGRYRPYERLNLAYQKNRKLGVFGRKLEGSNSLCYK